MADFARDPRVLSAALGAAAFFVLFGVHPLRVGAIDWLMRSDPATHYLGWAFYRNGPWSAWLLGEVPDYLSPLGTSVALTDSLPLLAVPLRAVQSWLPRPFQYIGLWLLACFALQGVAGARLAARLASRLPLFSSWFGSPSPRFLYTTFSNVYAPSLFMSANGML